MVIARDCDKESNDQGEGIMYCCFYFSKISTLFHCRTKVKEREENREN